MMVPSRLEVDAKKLAAMLVEGNVQVAAFSAGVWTAAGVGCAIQSMRDSMGSPLTALICLHPVQAGNVVVSESDFGTLDVEGLQTVRIANLPGGTWGDTFSLLLRRAPTDRPGIAIVQSAAFGISSVEKLVRELEERGRSVRVLLVDAGFICASSPYLKFLTRLFSTQRQESKYRFVGRVVLCAKLVLSNLLSEWLLDRRFPIDRRELVTWKDGRLHVDRKLADQYGRLLRTERRVESQNQRHVLILTQPFLDYLDEHRVRALLEGIAEAVRLAGGVPRIKVHPREVSDHVAKGRYRGLENDLYVQPAPVERLLAETSEIGACVGFTSTSLITGPLLFGCPAISVAKLLSQCGWHPFVRQNIHEFSKKAETVVAVVDSLRGLTAALKATFEKQGHAPDASTRNIQ